MLRYYDELGLLKPIQIDKLTGYRLYSVKQVSTLQKIIMLRDLNFSVSEMSKILAHWDDEFIIQQLQGKIEETQFIMQQEQLRINHIKMAIDTIRNKNLEIKPYHVTIKPIPSYKVLSLRKMIAHYNCEGILWDQLFQFANQEHVSIVQQSPNNMAIYHDEEHKDEDVDVEVCMIVNKLKESKEGFVYREIESVATMASMMVYGSYDHLNGAYQSMVYWLDEHPHYEMAGLSRQICHKGAHNEKRFEDFLTEIQTPVKIKNL